MNTTMKANGDEMIFSFSLARRIRGKAVEKNCWKRSLNEREFESMTTLSSFLTLSPLDRNNAEHRSTIESKINSRCECRPGQQSPFTVQCSRESSAHYYMVSPVRLRLILPHSLDPTHHAVAVVAVCTKCWWEGRRPMGEFSSWLHFCADSMKMKAGKVFLQRFHKSKFPIISFPLFHTLHARIHCRSAKPRISMVSWSSRLSWQSTRIWRFTWRRNIKLSTQVPQEYSIVRCRHLQMCESNGFTMENP